MSFLRKHAAEAGQADGDDQDRALEDELRAGRRAEDGEAVEADGDDQHADEGAEDMELAVAQRGRAEEHGGEGGQQIAVGGAGRAAAEPRGEQDAGERRADAGGDEAEDLDAVDIDAGEPRRRRIAADRLDRLADRGALDQEPEEAAARPP